MQGRFSAQRPALVQWEEAPVSVGCVSTASRANSGFAGGGFSRVTLPASPKGYCRRSPPSWVQNPQNAADFKREAPEPYSSC